MQLFQIPPPAATISTAARAAKAPPDQGEGAPFARALEDFVGAPGHPTPGPDPNRTEDAPVTDGTVAPFADTAASDPIPGADAMTLLPPTADADIAAAGPPLLASSPPDAGTLSAKAGPAKEASNQGVAVAGPPGATGDAGSGPETAPVAMAARADATQKTSRAASFAVATGAGTFPALPLSDARRPLSGPAVPNSPAAKVNSPAAPPATSAMPGPAVTDPGKPASASPVPPPVTAAKDVPAKAPATAGDPAPLRSAPAAPPPGPSPALPESPSVTPPQAEQKMPASGAAAPPAQPVPAAGPGATAQAIAAPTASPSDILAAPPPRAEHGATQPPPGQAAPAGAAETASPPPAMRPAADASRIDPASPLSPDPSRPVEAARVDLPTLSPAPQNPAEAPPARPQAPPPATGQPAALAQIVREATALAADAPLELTLDPPELGRVRLVLHPGEGGAVLQIAVDRAETLELMRRHADQLATQLRDHGLGDTGFAFSRDQGHEPARGSANGDQPGPPGPAPAPSSPRPPGDPRGAAAGTLDLRL